MKKPWTKFYWSDWQGDPLLRVCSLSAQGLWMRMLCLAAEADPVGYVKVSDRACTVTDLSRLTGESEETVTTLLDELNRNGVFSTTRNGIIYSRKMVRDEKKARTARDNGAHNSPERKDNSAVGGGIGADIGTPQRPETRTQTLNLTPPKDGGADLDFEKWYKVYPRKEGRGHALKAYRAACKLATPEILLAGAIRYAESRAGEDPKFTKHPKTWLTGRCWEDVIQAPQLAFSNAAPRTPISGIIEEYQANKAKVVP